MTFGNTQPTSQLAKAVYKFINDRIGVDEAIPVACAVNGNSFTVGGKDATLDAVCFGACTLWSSLPAEEVTFTVLTDNIVAEDGMYRRSDERMVWRGHDGQRRRFLSLTKPPSGHLRIQVPNGAGGYEELTGRQPFCCCRVALTVQGCFAQCAETCSVDPDPADDVPS